MFHSTLNHSRVRTSARLTGSQKRGNLGEGWGSLARKDRLGAGLRILDKLWMNTDKKQPAQVVRLTLGSDNNLCVRMPR